MCKIGQDNRCTTTGCEWLKVFGIHCIDQPINNIDVKNFYKKNNEIKPIYVPSYDTSSFVRRKKSKPIEIKNILIEENKKLNLQEVKPENKFKLASQDDWIKKIKVKL